MRMILSDFQGGVSMFFLQAEVSQQAGWLGVLLPFIAVFVVFYFLLWRPQQQQQKERKEMLAGLHKGDRIITLGGIHGVITDIKDDVLTVRIGDKVEVRLDRNGVGQVKGDK